jgi:hypothetical protein
MRDQRRIGADVVLQGDAETESDGNSGPEGGLKGGHVDEGCRREGAQGRVDESEIAQRPVRRARQRPNAREPIVDKRERGRVVAGDVRRLWDHPDSPPEFKKHILRTLLKEIIATSDGDTIRLVLHWQGGDHIEVTFEKERRGRHRYVTADDTIELFAH